MGLCITCKIEVAGAHQISNVTILFVIFNRNPLNQELVFALVIKRDLCLLVLHGLKQNYTSRQRRRTSIDQLKKKYNEPKEKLSKKSTLYVKKYHTVESVKTLMLDLKEKREIHLAELKKKQEAEHALALSIKDAVGSAL